MSSDISRKEIEILDRAKEFLGIKTDTALAERLGITQSAPANWRRRGSINLSLVLSACEGVNYNWLLTGEGEMRYSPPTTAPETVGRLLGEFRESASEPVGFFSADRPVIRVDLPALDTLFEQLIQAMEMLNRSDVPEQQTMGEHMLTALIEIRNVVRMKDRHLAEARAQVEILKDVLLKLKAAGGE